MTSKSEALLNSLQSLGLSEREASAYRALCHMKKGTAASVSARAGIKRPTCYGVLGSLEAKGLVSSTLYRGVRDWRALSPSHLRRYVEAQRRTADAELPAMRELYAAREGKHRLRRYEGAAGVKLLLEKSLRERAEVRLVGDERALALLLGDYWPYYLKRSAQTGILPIWKAMPGPVVLLVWSDKAALVDMEGPVRAVALKEADISGMYRELWNAC